MCLWVTVVRRAVRALDPFRLTASGTERPPPAKYHRRYSRVNVLTRGVRTRSYERTNGGRSRRGRLPDGRAADSGSPTMTGGTSAATVLAVDDEPDLAELYRVYLDSTYDVRIATGGEGALAEMDDSVDVVLLDRRMPDMSGHEVLSAMREAGYDARVAMLTAVEPDVDIVDMPFDDYKTKPVTKEDLLTLVEVLLHRAEFDEHSQEFFALASKKAVLEATDATNTDEYEELIDRMESVRERVDDTLDHLSARDAFVEVPGNVP